MPRLQNAVNCNGAMDNVRVGSKAALRSTDGPLPVKPFLGARRKVRDGPYSNVELLSIRLVAEVILCNSLGIFPPCW